MPRGASQGTSWPLVPSCLTSRRLNEVLQYVYFLHTCRPPSICVPPQIIVLGNNRKGSIVLISEKALCSTLVKINVPYTSSSILFYLCYYSSHFSDSRILCTFPGVLILEIWFALHPMFFSVSLVSWLVRLVANPQACVYSGVQGLKFTEKHK